MIIASIYYFVKGYKIQNARSLVFFHLLAEILYHEKLSLTNYLVTRPSSYNQAEKMGNSFPLFSDFQNDESFS